MEIVKTSSRGQLVIPEEVRKRYNIKEGTKLILIEDGSRIILEKEEKIKEILNEERGWNSISEESLNEVWDNDKDDKIWEKYL
jgi:AbrB family looped-hinge helix DNA binding protein